MGAANHCLYHQFLCKCLFCSPIRDYLLKEFWKKNHFFFYICTVAVGTTVRFKKKKKKKPLYLNGVTQNISKSEQLLKKCFETASSILAKYQSKPVKAIPIFIEDNDLQIKVNLKTFAVILLYKTPRHTF